MIKWQLISFKAKKQYQKKESDICIITDMYRGTSRLYLGHEARGSSRNKQTGTRILEICFSASKVRGCCIFIFSISMWSLGSVLDF